MTIGEKWLPQVVMALLRALALIAFAVACSHDPPDDAYKPDLTFTFEIDRSKTLNMEVPFFGYSWDTALDAFINNTLYNGGTANALYQYKIQVNQDKSGDAEKLTYYDALSELGDDYYVRIRNENVESTARPLIYVFIARYDVSGWTVGAYNWPETLPIFAKVGETWFEGIENQKCPWKLNVIPVIIVYAGVISRFGPDMQDWVDGQTLTTTNVIPALASPAYFANSTFAHEGCHAFGVTHSEDNIHNRAMSGCVMNAIATGGVYPLTLVKPGMTPDDVSEVNTWLIQKEFALTILSGHGHPRCGYGDLVAWYNERHHD